ncbi:MAG: DUF2269 domain-containing protein [Actinobacteria bacterium]|nr:DUF2269 domain-containing protein [Actinomycetota bacterium]
MRMPSGLRKAMLAVHLTVSVGWIGAVIVYLALGLTAVNSSDDATIRGMWAAMDSTGWYAIVPLALAALLTGVIMAVGTPWGLFRHYWVIISLVLTLIAVAVLLLHMPAVTATAELARTSSGDGLAALGGDLAHPAIGLVVLLVVEVLNVYKPRGTTRAGAVDRR